IVCEESHLAILVIVMHRALGSVHWQRLVVSAEAMAMSVRVSEDAGLQHLVGRKTDAGNYITWLERRLFDFGEVIIWIAVQFHNSDVHHRIVGVRPDFSQVKRIVGSLLRIRFSHDLHLKFPSWKIAALDRVKEVFLSRLPTFADDLCRFGICPMLMSLHCFEMELHPKPFAVGIDEAVGVTPVAIDVTYSDR